MGFHRGRLYVYSEGISSFRHSLRGLNSSFITLISKVESLKEPGDFMHTSLINFTMKILLKALSYKLSLVLNKIISEN